MVGVGNGLIIGYLMYRSGLVPRGLTMLGLIGGPLICITGLADQPATAEVGVTLAPARQGSGLATEALGAIVSTLFEVTHMHRVFGQADDRNTAAELFGRLRFLCEARQVEADWFKGEWTTMRVYAMLEREWRAARAQDQRR